jgi:hypothetical protein
MTFFPQTARLWRATASLQPGAAGWLLRVALLASGVAAVIGAPDSRPSAPASSEPAVAQAVATAAEDIADLPLDGSTLVVEQSNAPGCQPWRWNRDNTGCINATVARAQEIGARGVGLTRGREYRYSGQLQLAAGLAFGAVGDPSLPRPILRASRTATGIKLPDRAEVRNLDVRGPYYDASPFRVRLHDDWAFLGINGAGFSGWSVLGTSVNGFPGTGLLAVMSDDIRVIRSSFSHNGYSGVSLFSHEGNCGRGVEFRGNVLERNGQDGVDACSSNARYEDSVFRHNGWDGNGGDMNGLLVYTFSTRSTSDIRVVNNTFEGNNENGLRVAGTDVSGVVVERNRMSGNLHWGMHLGDERGLVRDARIRDNQISGNERGCISPATAQVVAPARAGCPR